MGRIELDEHDQLLFEIVLVAWPDEEIIVDEVE
jgi:hypothetical protein